MAREAILVLDGDKDFVNKAKSGLQAHVVFTH